MEKSCKMTPANVYRCVLLLAVLAPYTSASAVDPESLHKLGYTSALSLKQLEVTNGSNTTTVVQFQVCRIDNHTNFSVVVGKGSGPVYIHNTRVDYPVYKKGDITITYNQEWFPDKFCKRVNVYVHGDVVNNGTMLQFGFYHANQTNPNIVEYETVLFTVEDDDNTTESLSQSGTKDFLMSAKITLTFATLCMWWGI